MDTASSRHLQRKVLIVEDNELNRKLLEVRLEIHGYEALTTSEGAAALDIAREQQPDLILMDIQLPDISGIEAIRRLKADERTMSIPIIVVSAFAMSYEKASILASGCEAYITKPFKGEELAAMIERYTGRGAPKARGSAE
jgi:two-component system cell cycle response regulator DivK